MTREERKASAIAQKIVDALAELELFDGDADLVLEEALICAPRRPVSEAQQAEMHGLVIRMQEEFRERP